MGGPNMCSATDPISNPWWRVDLGSTKLVGTIVILSRSDVTGSSDDLTNLTIRVGDGNVLAHASNLQRNTPILTRTSDLFYEVRGRTSRCVFCRRGAAVLGDRKLGRQRVIPTLGWYLFWEKKEVWWRREEEDVEKGDRRPPTWKALFLLRFCQTWTKRYLVTSQMRVKRLSRIHHWTILWVSLGSMHQVRQNQTKKKRMKTYWVGQPPCQCWGENASKCKPLEKTNYLCEN